MKNIGIIVITLTLISADCDRTVEPSNVPPNCSFSLPLVHSGYFANEDISIRVVATDIDGTVNRVEIFFDENSIATLNSEPFEYTYDTEEMDPGVYKLKAEATDDQGEIGSGEREIRIIQDLQEFTDSRDGNVYRHVTIGKQTWMADNLAYLPEVSPESDSSGIEPRYYVYDYDGSDVEAAKLTDNYEEYGVLYNFEAAKISCPEGWHLPDVDELPELWNYTNDGIGNNKNGVFLLHTSEGGNNYYGFSGLYAGVWHPIELEFMRLGERTAWWSSSNNPYGVDYAGFMMVIGLEELGNSMEPSWANKPAGLSVRCLKD